MPAPDPPEFRRRAIELARQPSATVLGDWLTPPPSPRRGSHHWLRTDAKIGDQLGSQIARGRVNHSRLDAPLSAAMWAAGHSACRDDSATPMSNESGWASPASPRTPARIQLPRGRDVAIPSHLVRLVKDYLADQTAPGRDALLFRAATDGNRHMAPATLYKQGLLPGPRGRRQQESPLARPPPHRRCARRADWCDARRADGSARPHHARRRDALTSTRPSTAMPRSPDGSRRSCDRRPASGWSHDGLEGGVYKGLHGNACREVDGQVSARRGPSPSLTRPRRFVLSGSRRRSTSQRIEPALRSALLSRASGSTWRCAQTWLWIRP